MTQLRQTTSASSLSRRRLCPGSARQEAGILDQENEWTGKGNELHRLYFTGERPEMLSAKDRETLDSADALTGKFLAAFREHAGIPEDAHYLDHRELPLMFSTTLSPDGDVEYMHPLDLFPGHVDLCREWPDYGARAICDFKSGFGEVSEAEQNEQLACYAVMRQQERPARLTGVAIVQPNNFGPRMTTALYDAAALETARAEILRIWNATLPPNAPLVAGEEQCRNCKAKVFCEAYRAKFLVVDEYKTRAIDQLTPDELAQCMDAIRFANRIKDDVSARLVELISAGQMPGWELKNTGSTTTVTDITGAMLAIVNQTVLSFDDVRGCLTLSTSKVATLLHEKGLPEKSAKALVASAVAPFSVITEKAKSPQRISAKKLAKRVVQLTEGEA